MSDQQLLIQKKIEELINKGYVDEAAQTLDKYENLLKDEKWLITTKSVLLLIKGDLKIAEESLKRGLIKFPFNADILYNLAYLHEINGNFQLAYDYYLDAEYVIEDAEKEVAVNAINNIKNSSINLINKQKIAVFIKPGLDNFIDDIIQGLSDEYRVRKILVSSFDQIDQGMEWADICWFEWCDELIIHGSIHKLAKRKKIICRIHRYEVFTQYPQKVNWENVDKLVVVANHIGKILETKIHELGKKTSIITISNGVDIDKYNFINRTKGYNIAYVGYIHLRKNPVLILQIMKRLVEIDNRYKLYIAGEFQDELLQLYWHQQIEELNLQNNIIFEGWQEDINNWLNDKNYLLSTSVHESFGYGVAEAMSRGIKPVIHNFLHAKEIWPEQFLFNTIDEALSMIMDFEYHSDEYRSFIKAEYSLKHQLLELKRMIENLDNEKENDENILINKLKKMFNENVIFDNVDNLTLFLPTFNRSEIVVSDIAKGYKLGSQNKIIVDDFSTLEDQKILKTYLEKDKSVKLLFHHKNQGVAKTYWTAFEEIKTKYTQFSRDDDLIFCLNRNEFINSIKNIGEEFSLVIPRYVVNLDEYGNLELSYDRSQFNNLSSFEILKYLFKTGEMMVLIAGAVVLTREMCKSLPDRIFRVSEDYVAITRYLSKQIGGRVKVSDSYVYVRRVSNNTLSRTMNKEKLTLHLLSLLISGYYCKQANIVTTAQLLEFIIKRCELINSIYGFGNELKEIIVEYIKGSLDVDMFVTLLNQKCSLELNLSNIPIEIMELPNLVRSN